MTRDLIMVEGRRGSAIMRAWLALAPAPTAGWRLRADGQGRNIRAAGRTPLSALKAAVSTLARHSKILASTETPTSAEKPGWSVWAHAMTTFPNGLASRWPSGASFPAVLKLSLARRASSWGHGVANDLARNKWQRGQAACPFLRSFMAIFTRSSRRSFGSQRLPCRWRGGMHYIESSTTGRFAKTAISCASVARWAWDLPRATS